MLRQCLTGQFGRTPRAAVLTFLCLVLIPTGLLAQATNQNTSTPLSNSTAVDSTGSSQLQPAQLVATTGQPIARTENGDASDETKSADADSANGAANPAPEPRALVLLGTGALVLLLLYTRRRVRVLATETSQA